MSLATVIAYPSDRLTVTFDEMDVDEISDTWIVA